MVQNPPAGFPRLSPYLLYRDAGAAVDFLTKAFGCTETVRMPGPNDTVSHAEVRFDEAVVMLGTPGGDFQSPKDLANATSMTFIYVDDVDKHYEVARQAGAEITEELSDKFYGDRTYTARDPEGHQWTFGQHTRDVSDEEMAQAVAEMNQGG